jgi:MoxR-like ATPase
MEIVEKTRSHPDIELGVSPRGSQALLKAVQVFAILQGRDYVEPDDIKKLCKPVLSHRIVSKQLYQEASRHDQLIEKILTDVEVPVEKELLQKGANR